MNNLQREETFNLNSYQPPTPSSFLKDSDVIKQNQKQSQVSAWYLTAPRHISMYVYISINASSHVYPFRLFVWLLGFDGKSTLGSFYAKAFLFYSCANWLLLEEFVLVFCRDAVGLLQNQSQLGWRRFYKPIYIYIYIYIYIILSSFL